MGEIAYAVKEEYADQGYEAGSLAVGDETYDLAEALENGNGYVVVDEREVLLSQRLDEQMALERVDLKEAEKARKPAATKAASKKE